jgi:hypothetical protein
MQEKEMTYQHNPKITIGSISINAKNRSVSSRGPGAGLISVGMQGATVYLSIHALNKDDVPVGSTEFKLKKEEALELIAAIKTFYDL